MLGFLSGLFLLTASTLMYEIVLTRLLSAVSWYYLAFVAVSMGMFGMTAGALAVQLRPDIFSESSIRRRIFQAALAMGISMPLTLLTMLAVPIGISRSVQTFYSFFLFSAIVAVPFFFSGVAVCLSLVKTPFPIGLVYFVDLLGAAAGCFGAVVLLRLFDASSAMFAIGALVFLAAMGYSDYAGERRHRPKLLLFAVLLLVAAAINKSTLYGVQPIWIQDRLDTRSALLTEIWNPISRVRAYQPRVDSPHMWGPSSRMPDMNAEQIRLLIDNDASTEMTRNFGNPDGFPFLRWDVTSIAAQLRRGGEAAIIGVGGGRDVINAWANGFRRIVGIEVNSAIVELTSRRFDSFSGFSKIPNFELHNDEGRSYLSRTGEKFDLIQASFVDTWASTAAGAMTLTENSLYTVEGWRIFYHHLKPGGLISFSRWYRGEYGSQTYRLFSLAKAALLAEGVPHPETQLALIGTKTVATLLLSSSPFSSEDLTQLRRIASDYDYQLLVFPGEEPTEPELRTIASARTLQDLKQLRYTGNFDYAPVTDSSPFFFSAVRIQNLAKVWQQSGFGGSVRAIIFLFCFMLAAVALVVLTILLPLTRWALQRKNNLPSLPGGLAYFIAIGFGFMLVEMGMIQQLSVFLGHPTYSLVVVLAGLIFWLGLGSLASEKFDFASALASHVPGIIVGLVLVIYLIAIPYVMEAYLASVLWHRILFSLLMIAPCGLTMGFCFPVGLRWLTQLGHKDDLAWMWALNGASSVLASFVAILISMETSIVICILTGAACYLLAAVLLPWSGRVRFATSTVATVRIPYVETASSSSPAK